MKIIKNSYPDGTYYPIITDVQPNETLIFRINSYNDLWFLNQIKDTLDHMKVRCQLVIPCLLDAQADDRFLENSSDNLNLVCKFIDGMKWESVSILHPHNKEVVKALIKDVKIIDNRTFIKQVVEQINSPNLCLLSPDAGAYKWIIKLADNIEFTKEVYSASKSRKWEDGKTKLTQTVDIQDFKGQDILIVDDIIIGGGSVIGLSKILKERNCGKLYVAATHITISHPNPILFDEFDQVFTTDSKGINYGDWGNVFSNLNIIKIQYA